MKNLTLIRHAKSSWEYQVTDFERPLKKRGLEDAKLVSAFAKDKINHPNLILSSDANRARSTAEIFRKNLNFQDVDFQLHNKLYDFSGRDLIEVIQNCNNSINNLMVFGHNHAITAFVNTFGSIPIDNVPTCGVVCINFDIDSWQELKKGETVLTVFPKNLK